MSEDTLLFIVGFVSAVALQKHRKKKTVIWPIDLTGYPVGENME